MEFRHLRYFAAVAECGHIGRAAARLHVAKQPLSQQIRDLERELGVALFVRHPRGMALTRAGEELLVHAREMLRLQARAVEQVRRPDARVVLRLGLPDYPPLRPLVRRALADFRRRYPTVAFAVDPGAYEGHARAIAERRLDIAFTTPGAASGEAGAVSRTRMITDEFAGVVLPEDHPLAACAVVGLEDLRRSPLLVVRAADPPLADAVLERFHGAGWRGAVGYEAPDTSTVTAMLGYGLGWAHVPSCMAGVPLPGAVYRPLAEGGGTPLVVDALTHGDAADPVVTELLACLRAARDELAGRAPPGA